MKYQGDAPQPARRRVSTTLSAPVASLIDELLATGLFGRTRADVVREAINRFAREHIALPQTCRAAQQRRRGDR
jgi:Arc/MetJ-type ribon-helix-helix transcriptional regulator